VDPATEPSPPAESAPPPRRRGWWFLLPILALAYILWFIRLPSFVIEPGPAEDVEPLIHVQQTQVYPSRGHFLLTAVSFYQPNVYQALGAWLSRSESVLPERDLLAPGQTQQQETQVALSQMDQSKIDAAVVALTRYAGYPAKHGMGALIESVGPGTPADGKLFAGDLIAAIDGKPITSSSQVGPPIRAAGAGHPVTFTVQAGGQTRTVSVAPANVRGVDHPIVGISVVDSFPFPLTINSGDIGGPSAGLMWTLGLIDLITPGDLTEGRTIAGTGTIALDGTVGPIGGIQQKVVAAQRSRATVFFAPAGEAADARSVAHGITIVPVRTYLDALTFLGQH
jgi:PDZ domain-containing protein